MARSSDRGERIEAVVAALQGAGQHGGCQGAAGGAPMQHLRTGLVFGQCPISVGAEVLDFRPAAAREHARERRIVAIDDQPADAGHRAHQMMELGFDRAEVGKDVRMIEFEVVQDGRLGPVMNKLAALVEERGVVFVGLDDEKLRRLGAVQTGRDFKIARHAADQEARCIAGIFEDPGQHRRRGGLAMGTGHRQHPAAGQDVLGDPLRPAGVRQTAIEDGLHQRIAARHHIADHI